MWNSGIRRSLFAYGLAVVATLLLDAIWLAVPGEWGVHIPFPVFLFVVAAAPSAHTARGAVGERSSS